MTSKHYDLLLENVRSYQYSYVQLFNSTIAQIANVEQDESALASYVDALLRQFAFTTVSVEADHVRFYEARDTSTTKTIILFSSCFPHDDAYTRWGAFVTRLLTMALYHNTIGKIPINIVWIVALLDHESYSDALLQWITQSNLVHQADMCLFDVANNVADNVADNESGDGVHDTSLPTLYLALGTKGLLRIKLKAESFSEQYPAYLGTILPNVAWRLTWALGSVKDAREEMLIGGFYEHVIPFDDDESLLLQNLRDGEPALMQHLQVDSFLLHLSGLQLYYAYLLLPTCVITDMTSVYNEPSQDVTTKIGLPTYAQATLNIYLVPDQDPQDIYRKLRAHLDDQGFQDISLELLVSQSPRHTALSHKFAMLACENFKRYYGEKQPIFPLLPQESAYYSLQSLLNTPILYIGMKYTRDEAFKGHEGYSELAERRESGVSGANEASGVHRVETESTTELLYEHDTVDRRESIENQEHLLIAGIHHLLAIIEGIEEGEEGEDAAHTAQ